MAHVEVSSVLGRGPADFSVLAAGDGSSKDYSMFEAVNIEANQTCTQAIGAGQQLARLLGHE